MTNYKVIYFDIHSGRGEAIRYLLFYGNLPFEDLRVSTKNDEWEKLKPKTPFGQLPILEIDGKPYYQSRAIYRYLANIVNLAGKNELENLEIDAVVDTIEDLRNKGVLFNKEKNDSVKELYEAELVRATRFYLDRLDEMAHENKGHLALKRLTWADIYFLGFSDAFKRFTGNENIFDNYPNLLKVIENVSNIPTIKSWIEKRVNK